jgi:hypothetical protein
VIDGGRIPRERETRRMNQFAQRFAMAVLLVGALALPADADAIADVQTHIDAAMKSAKSFVVTTLDPAQNYSSTVIHIAPDRSRIVVAVAATTTDLVAVGETEYSSKNGAPFEKATVTPQESARLKAIGTVKIAAVRPDVSVDGVTYGAFDAALPFGVATTLTCTYFKKSYRLVRCISDDVTQVYKAYDDPSNVVEVPTNVAQTSQGGK